MGKSSLLIRTAQSEACRTRHVAYLDFQLVEERTLKNADEFFRQFCAWISATLGLPDRTENAWKLPFSNSMRATSYVRNQILRDSDAPIVLAMDEVDRIFDSSFRSDFFGMLRAWHNNRAVDSAWNQLDLVLVTSTEPYQLIDNMNQSPFNVGEVIELEDFTPEQVAELNARHPSPLPIAREAMLFDLLSGHPYLTRRALYLVCSGRATPDELFAKATQDRGPFGDHLRHHLFRLHKGRGLEEGLREVLRTRRCADPEVFFRLRGAGLVTSRTANAVSIRCRLYGEYFSEALGV
jgi:hypothetical protein